MGPFSDRLLKEANIVVSNHAIKRLFERCRLLMREHEKDQPAAFIRKQFRDGFVDMKIRMSPFDNAKLQQKHGAGSFILYSSVITVRGVYAPERDEVIIKTITRAPKCD